MKKLSVQQLAVLTFCLMLGLCVKKIVSPFTNIFTDFFRIPGGSAATGFSLACLALGCSYVPEFGVGTLMGVTQGILALFGGISGYQGIFCVLTYTVPGIVIDFTGKFFTERDLSYFITICSSGNVMCALFSNFLVFHLSGPAFLTWILMAASSGVAGGIAASMVYVRVWTIVKRGRWDIQ